MSEILILPNFLFLLNLFLSNLYSINQLLDQILKLRCRHFQMKKNFPSRSSSYSKPGQNGCNKLVALLEETIMIMNIVCIIVCLWSQYPERTLSHFLYYKNLNFINVLYISTCMVGWFIVVIVRQTSLVRLLLTLIWFRIISSQRKYFPL